MTSSLSNRGVYALLLHVPSRLTARIGALGDLEFATGVYVYIGSARNSLSGRTSRHLRQEKKKHWHIDYLLDGVVARPIGVAWRLTNRRIECSISQRISGIASGSVEGFGCSDCDCGSHLHHFLSLRSAVNVLSQVRFRFSLRPPAS